MAFGTITSTSNTFGSVDGTATGVVPGTLSGSIGVPGPQGPTGATGPQGPAGAAGVGVPAGGTAGQFLTKINGTNYNTNWTTLDISVKRDLTDYDFTNVADEKLEVFGLTINPLAGTTIPYDSYLNDSTLRFSYDGSNGGTVEGVQLYCQYADASFAFKRQDWANVDGDMIATLQYGAYFDATNGLKFINWNGTTQASTMQYGRTSITFPNASVQTIAFPGFANAALTGNPTAPTAALGDNDTSIATTAFVQQELASGTAVAKNLEVRVRNQSGSTMAAGTIVYISGATGNLPLITKAQANNDANSAQTIGFVKTSIANNGTGYVIVRGELENIDTSALSEGAQLYLSPSTAGTWTTTKPSAPQHLVYVGVVIRSHPTLGVILVSVQNGFEVAELHDSAISSPANNDLFVYELSTDLWKNKSFATLGLLTSATAASTYAPLASPTFTGTVTIPAGASISGYAPLASPTFTGTPSLPTGTTAVTQSAGNNTTALATTAFVQQEVPAASTTAAGKVELATDAEVIAGTSTTLALVPGHSGFLKADPRLRSLSFINSTAAQGSGAVSGTTQTLGREIYLSSLATGRASVSFGIVGTANLYGSLTNRRQTDFSKKIWISGYASFGSTFSGTAYTGDSNTMCRITLGGYSTNTTGDMTLRGIGLKKVGGVSSVVTLTVHNGTGLTDVATTTTVADGAGIHWMIYSDGTGNVTLYINGVQAATTTAGPTSATGTDAGCYREQVEATATPGVRQAMNMGGGWFYLEG